MAKPVLGIVGGIGSGKSRVAAVLSALGGHLIDADLLGHEALRQSEVKEKVMKRWGKDAVDENGAVNRRRLGRIVFADPAERQALEAIVFPWIERRIDEEIQRGQVEPRRAFIVLDAAIMLETGWNRVCDKIVFVDAPRALRAERVRQHRGWSAEELERRERSQIPLEEKKRQAHAVVANTGAPEQLHDIVKALLQSWGWACVGGPDVAQ